MPALELPAGFTAIDEPAPTPRRLALSSLPDWVGRDVGVSGWVRVDQDIIDRFAQATGDLQWIHVDPERASQSPYGQTIAHGFLTLSLLPWMRAGVMVLDGAAATINYGLNRVRFMAPVRVGSVVRGRFALQSIAPASQGMLLTWQATVEIRGQEKPACVAEVLNVAVPKAE